MLPKSILSVFLFLGIMGAPQAPAQGVDLNPALFGCIMSGGECLSNTGIPFIDKFFGGGGTVYHTDESFCRIYLSDWCSAPMAYPSAHDNCREAKKDFYKAVKQKSGEWNPPRGAKQHTCGEWTEADYFEQIERDNTKRDEAPYFTCTPRQQYIWLKNRCGHTQAYQQSGIYIGGYSMSRKYKVNIWDFVKTQVCERTIHRY